MKNKLICGDSKPTTSCYLDSGYKISVTTDSTQGIPGEFLSDYSDNYFKITNYIVN